MQTPHDIARLLSETATLRNLLEEVEALQLPEGCIAAGMVRNAVWDALHGREPGLHPGSDVDVVYFDALHTQRDYEAQLEARLRAQRPDIVWQVRNQARMHARNGDAPYLDCSDALCHFPETATAISARCVDGEVVIDAPLGVSDLLALIVRPTPHFEQRLDIYRARLASKDWAQHWPRLRFERR